MIKNNKWKFIISSLLILLPMLYILPIKKLSSVQLAGFAGAFIFMPAFLFVLHVVLLLVESKQQQKMEQSEKINNILFWILPAMSVYVCSIMFALALGLEFSVSLFVCPLFGVMFIVFGNYMPKSRQNHTFGMRVSWTLESEENWNATHRFSGKLWVVLGVIMLLCALLPMTVAIGAFVVVTLVAVVVPLVYSYRFHKKEIASGEVKKPTYTNKKPDKKTSTIAGMVTGVALVFAISLVFIGKLNFTFNDESMTIKASFGGKLDIVYSEIEDIKYRDCEVDGTRVSGFASSKLYYGWFKNEEFGNYVRYTYANSGASIVMIVNGDPIVISDVDAESTKALYDRIMEMKNK